ncbi:MAG: sulfotransferase [Pseudomonas sp.]
MDQTPHVSLDPDSLIEEAKRETGLDNFGDELFREPLRILTDSLDKESKLSPAGRLTQRQRLVGSLAARLRMQDYLARYPEIRDIEITNPVVIVGFPRTGTTMLHRILANDRRFFAAYWYEVRFPSPFPGWDFDGPDPRIPAAEAEVEAYMKAVPDLAAMHPFTATGADEEILLLEHCFYSTMPLFLASVPSFQRWEETNDQTPGYEYLKTALQFLQWQKQRKGQTEGQRWVLKAPHHLHYPDLLLKVFPDAQIIQTHRDPVETIPSMCSFQLALRKLASDEADGATVGNEMGPKWRTAIQRTMRVREEFPAQFHDVWYRDTVSQPMAVVEQVYEFLDLPLTETARQSMEKWREDNRRENRAPHRYTPEQFGFTEQSLKEDFKEYRERFIETN